MDESNFMKKISKYKTYLISSFAMQILMPLLATRLLSITRRGSKVCSLLRIYVCSEIGIYVLHIYIFYSYFEKEKKSM